MVFTLWPQRSRRTHQAGHTPNKFFQIRAHTIGETKQDHQRKPTCSITGIVLSLSFTTPSGGTSTSPPIPLRAADTMAAMVPLLSVPLLVYSAPCTPLPSALALSPSFKIDGTVVKSGRSTSSRGLSIFDFRSGEMRCCIAVPSGLCFESPLPGSMVELCSAERLLWAAMTVLTAIVAATPW